MRAVPGAVAPPAPPLPPPSLPGDHAKPPQTGVTHFYHGGQGLSWVRAGMGRCLDAGHPVVPQGILPAPRGRKGWGCPSCSAQRCWRRVWGPGGRQRGRRTGGGHQVGVGLDLVAGSDMRESIWGVTGFRVGGRRRAQKDVLLQGSRWDKVQEQGWCRTLGGAHLGWDGASGQGCWGAVAVWDAVWG